MPQPTPYTPTTDFSGDELTNAGGRSTVRTAAVDAEFSALAATLAGILFNLSLNQRDDGEIRDGRVKLHTLAADVRAMLAVGGAALRGPWLTGTVYALRDVVAQSGNTYIAATAHTSGTFAADLAAGRWLLLALGTAVVAGAIPFAPTGTLSAATVQGAIEESDTENRALSAAAAALVPALLADLASTAAGKGAALSAFKFGSTSTATTVDAKMRSCIDAGTDFGLILGTGLTGPQRLANGAAINAAISAAKALGMSVSLPGGPVEFDGTLVAANGVNVYGHGNMGEIAGARFISTNLRYFGSGIALDMLGAAAVASRIQCCWSDLVIDGIGAGAAAQGVRVGWNQRAMPLLRNVTLVNFGHYGLNFADQNWNVSFENLRVDACGRLTTNSTGIYKDPAIDGGTWNGISFTGLQVEGCGTASSTAGGLNIQTATANRGLYFVDPIIEGNFGASQIYITRQSDLQFGNLYIEQLDIAGQVTGVELLGCNGNMIGGYISGANPANNLVGIKATGCNLNVIGVNLPVWGAAGVDSFGSPIRTENNVGVTVRGKASAQWSGQIAPRFAAHRNSVDQTGVVSGTFTKVLFTTEVYDRTNGFDTGLSRWTPQAVGVHRMAGSVKFIAMVDQAQVIVSIYRNGVAYKSITTNARPQTFNVDGDVLVSVVGDYFELFVRQSTGASQTISGLPDETFFSSNFLE